MPIESSEPNSHSYPRLPIDANQNQVVQNSHLTPWFWLMPGRSYNHSSYHLYFCWKLRMYCFVIAFIFDETQGFPPKEGMSQKKLIYLGIRIWDHSYGPQSYTSSFIMGPWTSSFCSEFPCEFKEKPFEIKENLELSFLRQTTSSRDTCRP